MGSGRVVICNTSPLINFAQIDRLDLLGDLFGEITVPPAVLDELRAKRDIFPKATAAADSPLLRVVEPRNVQVVSTLTYELHPGESECLALAINQPGAVLLIVDDLAARAVASHHQLAFTGSLGCLSLAKQRGLISQVGPLLNQMRQAARFWLNDNFVNSMLMELNERDSLS